MRVLVVAVLLAGAMVACRSNGGFECYTKPRNGVFRECQLARSESRLTACREYGCLSQHVVFCFQGVGQRICTPTREECTAWKDNWISVDRAAPETVCFETAADGSVR